MNVAQLLGKYTMVEYLNPGACGFKKSRAGVCGNQILSGFGGFRRFRLILNCYLEKLTLGTLNPKP